MLVPPIGHPTTAMMAEKARSSQRRSRSNFGIILFSVTAATLCASLSGHAGFTVGVSRRAQRPLGRFAEPPAAETKAATPAPAPAPSSSVALIVVNDENTATTASILAGLAGALLGGVWIGGTLFAAASYLSRQEGDIPKAIKGVAQSALEALNFGANLNSKYTVTDQIGGAVGGAVDKVKETTGDNEVTKTLSNTADTVGKAVSDLDRDVNIKGTVGNVVSAASEFAADAVERVVEVNEEYKVTEQIADKAKDVAEQVQSKVKEQTK